MGTHLPTDGSGLVGIQQCDSAGIRMPEGGRVRFGCCLGAGSLLGQSGRSIVGVVLARHGAPQFVGNFVSR